MAQRKTLLIVDDDADLRGAVAEQLQAEDFTTLEAATAGEGVRLAQTERPDLILLDVDLPDFDGREACRRIRESGVATPVIMLTAAAADEETVQGLDAGANDYVTKPFGIQELMARLRALLRQRPAGEPEAPPRWDDGRLSVDFLRREVCLDGAELALTRKEYAVLSLLLRHAGRVVTQPQLLREVWGPSHVADSQYLRIVIGKLRQKLGDDPASPRWLKTEPGVGYRFLG